MASKLHGFETLAAAKAVCIKHGDKIDWNMVYKIWLCENLNRPKGYSIKQLAKDLGLNHGTCRNRASKEKWTESLKRAQLEIKLKAFELLKEDLIINEAEVRKQQAQIAQIALAKAYEGLVALRPMFMTAKEVTQLFKMAMEQQRLALGLGSRFNLGDTATDELEAFLKDQDNAEMLAKKLMEFVQKNGPKQSAKSAD